MLIVLSAILIPTAALIAVLRQWRLCLYCLGLLFLLVGGIESLTIHPLLGLSKMVAGITAVVVLFISAQEAFSETHLAEIHGTLPRWEYLFETVAASVAAVGTILFARSHPLFGLSGPVTFAWTWLGLVGLIMIVLATNILEVGVGLLVFFSGLDLLVFATSLTDWWAALMVLRLAPIAIAFLVGLLGLELSQQGHSLRLDALKEKAPFVLGQTTPIRIKVRRRRSGTPLSTGGRGEGS
ncbi:MAG: hypothetical protein KGJ86_16910 [Chloroflexota bacterium]|nr:hypothetical protein [Chloroflexota bacterium]